MIQLLLLQLSYSFPPFLLTIIISIVLASLTLYGVLSLFVLLLIEALSARINIPFSQTTKVTAACCGTGGTGALCLQ